MSIDKSLLKISISFAFRVYIYNFYLIMKLCVGVILTVVLPKLFQAWSLYV